MAVCGLRERRDTNARRNVWTAGRRLGVVLILTLALGACASGATPGAMVPLPAEQTSAAQNSRLRQAIAIGNVSGGRETNPLWTSQVSQADFAAALRQSLSTHAMLTINNETFRLDATLHDLEQPFAGVDLQVTSRVSYRLVRVSDGTIAYTIEVRRAFTAPFSSSFLAVERLRLANEGAIRENIRDFLSALVAEEARNPAAFGGPGRRT